MSQKNLCSCVKVVGHLSHCPFRNEGLRVDFSDLLETIDKIGDYSPDNRIHDPKRIPKMLKMLEKVWKKNPHLRLAQLILNAFTCGGPGAPYGRIYTVEDKELLATLEKFYKKNR